MVKGYAKAERKDQDCRILPPNECYADVDPGEARRLGNALEKQSTSVPAGPTASRDIESAGSSCTWGVIQPNDSSAAGVTVAIS